MNRRNEEHNFLRYATSVQEAGVIVDDLLTEHQRHLLNSAHKKYRHFTTGKIDRVKFQEDAVKQISSKRNGIYRIEAGTGSGKTIIAAKASINFLKKHPNGHVIFICPNSMALGSEFSGIIQSYHRTFNHYKMKPSFSLVNKPSKAHNVLFFTPRSFLNKCKTNLMKHILAKTKLMIVDEAHHFPYDDKKELKIFGKIEQMTRKISKKARVVSLTGTHGRMDGKPPMGSYQVDFKYTVQDAVSDGRCPEIYGIQVILDVKCPDAKTSGDFYNLNLKGIERERYFRMIGGCMVKVWQKYPKPACAFVRTIADAKYLANIFNQTSGLGDKKGMRVIVASTPQAERQEIIEDINEGKSLGYITCAVGAEAVNIPSLEIAYMIVRTKSITRMGQSVGRSLRMHPKKKRVLIVDFNVMNKKIIESCIGIAEYGVLSGAKPKKQHKKRRFLQGGPIISYSANYDTLDGIDIEKEKAWIMKNRLVSFYELKKKALLQMSDKNMLEPIVGSKGYFELQYR